MKPVVAVVGRPNVGKSTLFNRLLGRRQSIVHDTPGVTRDRIYGSLDLPDGGVVELVDTGGLVLEDDTLGLNEQVLMAVEDADLLLLVVDGRDGLLGADQEVAERLRPYGKRMLVVVNKGDTRQAQESFDEFWSLGGDDQHLVSAEHGRGVEELLESVQRRVPKAQEGSEDGDKIAIVGRPNVGKSSLVNALLGQDRTLVSPTAGTTRDPVDTPIVFEDRPLLLVDTAGIRRRSQMSDQAESLAVMMARRQIERADVVFLVLDGSEGVTSGDLAIAGAVEDFGRAAVVVVNKWDLVGPEQHARLEEEWPRLAEILHDPVRINLSATSGRHLQKLLPAVAPLLRTYRLRVPTSELNRLLETAVARHHAPTDRGRPWKLYYATQVATGPPTFMVFANRGLKRQDPYRRYLSNFLREALGLAGVPIRLVVREKAAAR